MKLFNKNHIAVLVFIIGTVNLGYSQSSDISEGIKLYESQKYSQARDFFAGIVKSTPNNAEALFYLARSYQSDRDVEKNTRKKYINMAIDNYTKATELDPENGDYYYRLATAYGNKIDLVGMLSKMGVAKNTKKNYLKAVEFDPDNINARLGLMDYYIEAPGIAGGSVEKGLEQANAILKLDEFEGHNALAKIYEKEKEYDKAESEYLSAINLKPENINVRYTLGYMYYDLKKFEDSFAIFETAAAEYPGKLGAYYQMGRVASESGIPEMFDKALTALAEYVNHDLDENFPPKAWGYFRIGSIHHHKGETELAKLNYEKALELDPKHERAKDALKKIKK